MAIGSCTASSAVLAGLAIAVIAVPVAWATGFLEPPVAERAAEAADQFPAPAVSTPSRDDPVSRDPNPKTP